MSERQTAGQIVPYALLVGAITGLLTVFLPLPMETLPADPRAAGYIIHAPVLAPLGAPIYFGLGLMFLLNAMDRLSTPGALPILAGVFVGWLLAINLYLRIGDAIPPPQGEGDVATLRAILGIAIGAVCGAAGAAFTWLGAAVSVRRLMRFDAFLAVTATGLVVGGILVFSDLMHTPWKLFCSWQAAVAAATVWANSRMRI